MPKCQPEAQQMMAVMAEVLTWEAACIERVAARLDSSFVSAAELILNCHGKLILSGLGKMGAIAQKSAATFCSTGKPAIFLHPSEAHHGDLGVIAAGDLMIALSNSGETEELTGLIQHLGQKTIPVIAITGRANSRLARLATIALDIRVEREADPVTSAPTASTTVALAVCDALAIAVARARGLTAEAFAAFHPGGYLGRTLLLTIGELMHTGSRIPLIDPEASLREAIVVISRHALGCVFIINQSGALVGILTDGDLRRSLATQSNPLPEPVSRFMTTNPRTVTADMAAVNAIRLMEERAITVLPVVDESRVPIGVVHLHDLVKAGLG